MKNWSSRNKVIETPGCLHPLWPQDKRLHTPRTTDYRHATQDRWIQTELDSTLAKNATKPNPFEIILLQTTKKENNWKPEETLERAVVTLETERIKGSNPLCLWWWWWWWWWWCNHTYTISIPRLQCLSSMMHCLLSLYRKLKKKHFALPTCCCIFYLKMYYIHTHTHTHIYIYIYIYI